MNHLEELEHAVLELEQAYSTAREEVQKEADRNADRYGWGPSDPLRMQDTSGRYILLDALTTLVQARAAIVNARRQLDI